MGKRKTMTPVYREYLRRKSRKKDAKRKLNRIPVYPKDGLNPKTRKRNILDRYIRDKFSVDGLYVCQTCGFKHELKAVFDFHHVDPTKKVMLVSKAVGGGGSIAKTIAEIDKCIFICSNCHRIIHTTMIVDRQEKKEVQLELF